MLLIPYPVINPTLVTLGPLPIRWYALAYIAGFLFGLGLLKWMARKTELWGTLTPPTSTQLDDLLIYVAFGVILGGRLGEILFYNPPYYLDHPFDIFAVWKGGMSFHGGLL